MMTSIALCKPAMPVSAVQDSTVHSHATTLINATTVTITTFTVCLALYCLQVYRQQLLGFNAVRLPFRCVCVCWQGLISTTVCCTRACGVSLLSP
jgi:hypothetical protein